MNLSTTDETKHYQRNKLIHGMDRFDCVIDLDMTTSHYNQTRTGHFGDEKCYDRESMIHLPVLKTRL